MSRRVRLAVLALVLAASLGGCARPGEPTCDDPFPLVVLAYPRPTDPSLYEVQTTFWNCTDQAYSLDDPCGARGGLLPIVAFDGEWYYLGSLGELAAVPRGHVVCDESEFAPEPRTEAAPGAYIEQRYGWDGTYRPDGGDAVPVPPRVHVVFLRIGPFYDAATIETPW